MYSKELVIPKTIRDMIEARNASISLYSQALRLIEESEKGLKEIDHYLFPYRATPDMSLEEFRKELDQRLWRHALDKTGFFQFMDRQAHREFDAGLDKNPPEFSEDNIRSTLLEVASQADELFARGLVNVFRRLSKEHKSNTNEPFKVNRKAVMTYMLDTYWAKASGGGLKISYRQGASDEINDIDRVIKVLDGKEHHPRALEIAINEAFQTSNVYEDEYYLIRGFRNGNLHITFKREDLLDKANKVISQYYHGRALAA